MGLAALAVALSFPALPAPVDTLSIPNFHQVNERVFRGGQPPAESWQGLAKLGVKTVIDLRLTDEHSTEEEAKAVAAAGMTYVNVPMKGVVSPSNEQISKVLALLDSQDKVFVHCRRGADRTGTVIACYRIKHDRWHPKQALNEAKSFGMAWTQVGLKSYIKSFQPKNTDVSTSPAPAASNM
jgi:tyrosine-protein phosphatase SIW14